MFTVLGNLIVVTGQSGYSLVLIVLPNATIFFTYIQTVKMQDEKKEGRKERERGWFIFHLF